MCSLEPRTQFVLLILQCLLKIRFGLAKKKVNKDQLTQNGIKIQVLFQQKMEGKFCCGLQNWVRLTFSKNLRAHPLTQGSVWFGKTKNPSKNIHSCQTKPLSFKPWVESFFRGRFWSLHPPFNITNELIRFWYCWFLQLLRLKSQQ